MQHIVNNFVAIIAVLGLTAMLSAVLWDYWLYWTGGDTFSDAAARFYDAHRASPWIWIWLGAACAGFPGFVAGFILGHLFWPNP